MPVRRWQFRVWAGQSALRRVCDDEEGRELAAERLQECLCEKSEGTRASEADERTSERAHGRR